MVAAFIAVGFFILFSVIYFVRIESLVQYRIVAIAIMPSILGAATLVSLKSIGEFVKNLTLGDNSFNTVGYAIWHTHDGAPALVHLFTSHFTPLYSIPPTCAPAPSPEFFSHSRGSSSRP